MITAVIPLIIWVLFIYLLSSRQKIAFTSNYSLSFVVFKSIHLIEYAILFLLWLRLFHLLGIKNKFWWAFLATFLYGLSDEFHQSLIIGRKGKLRDALVDSLGGILGWYLVEKYSRLRNFVFQQQTKLW